MINLKLLLVLTPVIFSVAFTDYWLRRWGVFVWDNGPTIQNQQVWEDTAIVEIKEDLEMDTLYLLLELWL